MSEIYKIYKIEVIIVYNFIVCVLYFCDGWDFIILVRENEFVVFFI